MPRPSRSSACLAALLCAAVALGGRSARAQDAPPEEDSPPRILELPITVETPDSPADVDRRTNLGAVLSFSLTGAALVNAAVFGTMALAENGRLDDMCPCEDEQLDELRAYALVTDVSLVVAAVSAAVGAVFLLTWDDDPEHPGQERVELHLSPGGVSARGRF